MKRHPQSPRWRRFAGPDVPGPGMHLFMSHDHPGEGSEPGSRAEGTEFEPGPRLHPGPGGHGDPGFGPGGFGPGGFGPGGFGPPFVPPFARGRGHGPWGGGPRRGPGGRRGRRGNVRAAVLSLLSEGARHGYAIMNDLAERSGGLWRPSPGSIYPVLSQLQDEGLVVAEESEGRRNFSLTEAGRAYVTEHPEEMAEPWRAADGGPARRVQAIMAGMAALGAAVEQVARHGTEAQASAAGAVLDDARKRMYRILAEDDAEPGE